jgi:hypothetical protein
MKSSGHLIILSPLPSTTGLSGNPPTAFNNHFTVASVFISPSNLSPAMAASVTKIITAVHHWFNMESDYGYTTPLNPFSASGISFQRKNLFIQAVFNSSSAVAMPLVINGTPTRLSLVAFMNHECILVALSFNSKILSAAAFPNSLHHQFGSE